MAMTDCTKHGKTACCGKCGVGYCCRMRHGTRTSAGNIYSPLCQNCWRELEPRSRYPFYRSFVESMIKRGHVVTVIEFGELRHIVGQGC